LEDEEEDGEETGEKKRRGKKKKEARKMEAVADGKSFCTGLACHIN
jgi:hypothetical protein